MDKDYSNSFNKKIDKLQEDIKKLFSPEFRNRLDALVSFASLDNEIILKVGKSLERSLKKFNKITPDQILEERRKKFLDVGKFKL